MDQSHGAARERLERALPGSGVSGWNAGLLGLQVIGSVWSVSDEEDSGVGGLDPDRMWMLVWRL